MNENNTKIVKEEILHVIKESYECGYRSMNPYFMRGMAYALYELGLITQDQWKDAYSKTAAIMERLNSEPKAE